MGKRIPPEKRGRPWISNGTLGAGRKRVDGVEGKKRKAAFGMCSLPFPFLRLVGLMVAASREGRPFVKEENLLEIPSLVGIFRRRVVTAKGYRGWLIFTRKRDRQKETGFALKFLRQRVTR